MSVIDIISDFRFVRANIVVLQIVLVIVVLIVVLFRGIIDDIIMHEIRIRCAMVEFGNLARRVDFDTAGERPSAWWRICPPSSSRTLFRGVMAQLVVILLVEVIQLRLDVHLFAPAHSASAGMSMLLLHLLQHRLLFDLQQIFPFELAQAEPEIADVLAVLYRRLCPNLGGRLVCRCFPLRRRSGRRLCWWRMAVVVVVVRRC